MPGTWQEDRNSEISVYERPLIHDSFRSPKSARRERKLIVRKLLTGLSPQKLVNFPEPDSVMTTNPGHDI